MLTNHWVAPSVYFYKCNITSTHDLHETAELIRKEHGDPTVLVNNAGLARTGTILDESEAAIRGTFEVNILAHFWTVKEFLPAMIRNDHGHVVTVASMASFAGLGEMADYSASKAAALAFHETLGEELRYWYKAHRVRTSIMHPLWVATPMIRMLTDAGRHFSQPVMTVDKIADAIVGQIVSQRSGQVVLPWYLGIAKAVRCLPAWLQIRVRGEKSLPLARLRELEKKGVISDI